jgi:hypothetical protein
MPKCRHKNTPVYRMSQEERTIFWEVIVWVILSKKTLYEHVSYSERFPRYNHFSGLAWTPSIVLPSRPVAGGKVNILGGHSICHSKQKTLYERVSYSERFPRYSHLTV